MNLRDFDYQLPESLIAHAPVEPRDSARLLVFNRAKGTISHHHVRDLATLLPDNTLCVANNSRVRNARIHVTHDQRNQPYELLLLESLPDADTYCCMVRGKALTSNETLTLYREPGQPLLVITALHPVQAPGMTLVAVHCKSVTKQSVEEILAEFGEVPLPPYIKPEPTLDRERYQTVYARELGSAAAPTAGLHITPELLTSMEQAGHQWQEVTLHVGIGTFLPLKSDVITDNTLHSEATHISTGTAEAVSTALTDQRSILAIGTTSLRTLEGHYDITTNTVESGYKQTNIFIYPGKRIHTTNCLLTNFHLPKSSLLLLVTTFLQQQSDRSENLLSYEAALDQFHQIYQTAITKQYRFFSFGDAMLVI
jgi:S-adenosylmethionine:tRNA ribosyltransferase-isomerase